MNELERIPEEITIETGRETQLVVRVWTAPATGRTYIALVPMHMHRGNWRLKNSAVTIPPGVAPQLAAAVLAMAATVGPNGTTDPTP